MIAADNKAAGAVGVRAVREQTLTAERSGTEDVAQFQTQRVEFRLQRGHVIGRRRGVVRFGRQILHTQQHVGHFRERAFGGLHHGDAVLRVALSDGHAAGLSVQTGGDLQAGGVVHRAVDAVAGAQAGQGGGQGLLRVADRILRGQRRSVSVKRKHV
nr:hypothetical protein [Steroidobacter cummioxidans]